MRAHAPCPSNWLSADCPFSHEELHREDLTKGLRLVYVISLRSLRKWDEESWCYGLPLIFAALIAVQAE